MLTFLRIVRYQCSNIKYQKDLLASQFHQLGHRHFQRSRQLTRESSTNLKQIDAYTLNLQKIWLAHRNNQSNNHQLQGVEVQEMGSYVESYIKLIEAIKESKFNEEWYYLIAGWYNIQSLLPALIQKLLAQNMKNKHSALVEAVSWMRPHAFSLEQDLQFYELQRQNKNIDVYYKGLNNGLPLDSVRRIESIFGNMHTPNKGRFYERYVQSNLSSFIKHVDVGSREQVEQILWLYEMYVGTFNDKQDIIGKFDTFCQKLQPTDVSQRNMLVLMEIYSEKGRIDQKVYQKHLKKFITPKKDTSLKFAVKSLSFLLHSETEDSPMIALLLKHIEQNMHANRADQSTQLELHYLCHYMSVKGIKYELHRTIVRDLNECCRKHEGNGTLARTMAINLDQKGRQQGIKYYQSDCLRKQRQISAIKQDVGVETKKLKNIKKYNKVRICTMELNTCVMDGQSKEIVVLENVYSRFEHSKKMSRYFEVREAVLGHYGVKMNYLERKDTFRQKPQWETLDSLV